MYATDFMYDKHCLSDFGMIICDFDGKSGAESVSAGSQLTFNLVKPLGQNKWNNYSSSYSEYLTSNPIQICKNPCKASSQEELELTAHDISELNRWLNRKQFCKFKILQDDYIDIYFEGSFNVNQINIGGKCYGLELTLTTNRPYGFLEPVTYSIVTNAKNETISLYDQSDEIGYIYPDMTIRCLESGNLKIQNSIEDDRNFYLANVESGEIITLHGEEQIIESNRSSHNIYDDFNFKFPRICNTYENKNNVLTFSIPIECTLTYSPIRKVGI